MPYPHAWRYHDYVLDAVNRDVPFDRFIQEQVAGDLLPSDSPAERDRLLTATGFRALGVKDVNQRFKVRFIMDNVDEQIDAVTRSVLGLTVSCARCAAITNSTSSPVTGLLRARRHLHEHRPLRWCAGTRWAAAVWTTTTSGMLVALSTDSCKPPRHGAGRETAG